MVEYLFRWTGLVPDAVSSSAASAATRGYFAWDYTTFINIVVLPLGLWLGWIGRRRIPSPSS